MSEKEPFAISYSNVFRERSERVQLDSKREYIVYGENDSFPTRLSKLVQESPTATSCLSTLTDFITGEGFNNQDIENIVINNQGTTLFQLHNFTSDSLAHFQGFAWLFKFNSGGDIIEWYPIPFENCRLGVPDDKGYISKIFYNPYFGTELFKEEYTTWYDVWNNDSTVVLQQATRKGFKGQILWFGVRKSRSPFYPVPDYYSAKEWMEVESLAGTYFSSNLKNGYLQPSIFRFIGDPNQPAYPGDTSENPVTKGQMIGQMMAEEFSGAKRVGRIMAFWGTNRDEWPDVIPFPANNNSDTYRTQDDQATKKITIATKVPAILANISEGVSLGGDGNTIRAAVKLMQQRVVRPQSILTDNYNKVLPRLLKPINEKVEIVSYDPFPELESVDERVWDELTQEERRLWIKDHTNIKLLNETPLPAQDQETPQPDTSTQAKYTSLWYTTYPEKARQNAKFALDWQDKTGNKCSKAAGRKISDRIIKGDALSAKEIKRLSTYLSKNILHKDKEFDKSCDAVLFHAWGGGDMMTWANEKVKEIYG